MPDRSLRVRPAPRRAAPGGVDGASPRRELAGSNPRSSVPHELGDDANTPVDGSARLVTDRVRLRSVLSDPAPAVHASRDDVTRLVVGHLPRVAPVQRAAKRALDVLGALVGLALASPVLLLMVLAVRLDSPGRALFVQDRVGRGGRRFRCYKLRTMCEGAEAQLEQDDALRVIYEANGFKLPVECDPRVTSFGRFLRSSSLDELPQLWNVLVGDMSLVGPRPVVEAELVHYGAARELLLSVRPGITGAWAVSGRSCVNYPERADIELAYARGWTVAQDLAILWRTVGVVLQRQGAH